MTINWRQALMLAACIAAGAGAHSQSFQDGQKPWVVPAIPQNVSHAMDFVPNGWKTVTVKHGDLNMDRRDDVAVLMRMADPSRIVDNDSKYYPKDDQNPYLLVIGFNDGTSGFRLIATHQNLLPSFVTPVHGDTELGDGSVAIRRGVLAIELEHLRGRETYKFRWDGHDFGLIGYDCADVAGGTYFGLSANYLTRRAKIERGTVGEDKTSSWMVRIKPGLRPKLSSISMEQDWIGEDANGESLSC